MGSFGIEEKKNDVEYEYGNMQNVNVKRGEATRNTTTGNEQANNTNATLTTTNNSQECNATTMTIPNGATSTNTTTTTTQSIPGLMFNQTSPSGVQVPVTMPHPHYYTNNPQQQQFIPSTPTVMIGHPHHPTHPTPPFTTNTTTSIPTIPTSHPTMHPSILLQSVPAGSTTATVASSAGGLPIQPTNAAVSMSIPMPMVTHSLAMNMNATASVNANTTVSNPNPTTTAAATTRVPLAIQPHQTPITTAIFTPTATNATQLTSLTTITNTSTTSTSTTIPQSIPLPNPNLGLTVQDHPFKNPIYNGVNPNYPNLQVLHQNPPVFTVTNFLSQTECDFLINVAQDCFSPAPVVGKGAGEVSPSRTSSTCYLAREDLPHYLQKVSLLTGKPVEHCELPQVGRYLPSQQYLQHFDAFDVSNEDGIRFAQNGGQRTVTVLVYLNDVNQGGHTWFPNLNLSVQPKRGMALIFFPSTVDGLLDKNALHAAKPAIDTKYVSQVWIRQGRYDGMPSKRMFSSVDQALIVQKSLMVAREGEEAVKNDVGFLSTNVVSGPLAGGITTN